MQRINRREASVVACAVCLLAALVIGALLVRGAIAHRVPSGMGGHRTEFQIGLILVIAASLGTLYAMTSYRRSRRL